MTIEEKIALDSQRSFDESGHLRIAKTVLSKAGVNPYFGREIPNYEELGLEADRVYQLLRDPISLEKSKDSFKGKQLLIKHEYVDADKPEKDLIIGSIGSSISYEDGKLYGDVAVWDREAIELIETGKMKELSASYWYEADMKPGEYEGTAYDGIMYNIRGNHVALVSRGRIGRDAVISDSLPKKLEHYIMMTEEKRQRLAARLQKIASAGVAFDGDIEEIVREVAENIEHKPSFDEDKLRELVGDKYDEVIDLIGARAEDEEDDIVHDEDEGEKAREVRKELEEIDRDDRDAKRDDMLEDEDKDDKPAMDADAIAASVQAKIEAKYKARDKVEPLVGRIALDGFKTAAEIYAYALKHKGIACDGVNEKGLEQMVALTAKNSKSRAVAQDSDFAAPSKFTSRFKRG